MWQFHTEQMCGFLHTKQFYWCPLGKKKGIQSGSGGKDGVENAKEFTDQASIFGSIKRCTWYNATISNNVVE